MVTRQLRTLRRRPSPQGVFARSSPGLEMPTAFAILIGAQLVGEALRGALHAPLPGPLIGMFLLAVVLIIRGQGDAASGAAAEPPLHRTANALIANMGFLFVPAGVGIVDQSDVLRSAWFPLLAGVLVSTVLGLTVTGLIMHHLSRVVDARDLPTEKAGPKSGSRS